MDRLRHLSNPSAWYKDPKVAKAQFEQLNKILDTETETYRKNGTSPINLQKLEFKDGKFVLGKEPSKQTPEKVTPGKNEEEGSFDLKAVIPQLLKINSNYTEDNIKATAKKHNTTVDNIVNQLFQRSVRE